MSWRLAEVRTYVLRSVLRCPQNNMFTPGEPTSNIAGFIQVFNQACENTTYSVYILKAMARHSDTCKHVMRAVVFETWHGRPLFYATGGRSRSRAPGTYTPDTNPGLPAAPVGGFLSPWFHVQTNKQIEGDNHNRQEITKHDTIISPARPDTAWAFGSRIGTLKKNLRVVAHNAKNLKTAEKNTAAGCTAGRDT